MPFHVIFKATASKFAFSEESCLSNTRDFSSTTFSYTQISSQISNIPQESTRIAYTSNHALADP
jgi:hypothetical protein